VVIRMLENVQQKTIRPLIETFLAPGTRVHTDEYDIFQFVHNTRIRGKGLLTLLLALLVS